MSLSSGKSILPASLYQLFLTSDKIDKTTLKLLLAAAERLYAGRSIKPLQVVADRLRDHSPEHANYYQALILLRQPLSTAIEAKPILNALTDSPIPELRARAHVSLGALNFYQQNLDEADKEYRRALDIANGDGWAILTSIRSQAVIESYQNRHYHSLAILDALAPIALQVGRNDPASFWSYVNSLASELLEVNKREEAKRLTGPLSKSGLIEVYHEWQETVVDERLGEREPLIVVPDAQKTQKARKPKPRKAKVLDFVEDERAKIDEIVRMGELANHEDQNLVTIRQANAVLESALKKRSI